MIPDQLYYTVYLWSLAAICFAYVVQLSGVSNNTLLKPKNNFLLALIICLILIFYFAFRPASIGDTSNYSFLYDVYAKVGVAPLLQDIREMGGDWLFTWTMMTMAQFFPVEIFFLLIATIYLGCFLLACKRFSPNNPLLLFLICITTFQFFSYGTNGIRNGAACALVALAITFVNTNNIGTLIAAGLSFMAISIHHSTLLPVVMMFASAFFIKDFKWALFFWILSILLSLTVGNSVANIFAGLGFDDRFDVYLSSQNNLQTMKLFSKTGFRWDFLLFSCVPIIIGYIVVVKHRIKDDLYMLLLNTYTLSNAFWVIVIRASFSNRFAYLSWFLYGIVLAYPFLKLNVWQNQGQKLGILIIGNLAFCLIMS